MLNIFPKSSTGKKSSEKKEPSEKRIVKSSIRLPKELEKSTLQMILDEVQKIIDSTPKTPYTTGRPTDYKPEYCKTIIVEMAKGKSKETVAIECGITPVNFHQWIKKNPEFRYAIKIGEMLSERWWAETGRENLWNKNFNHVLWMMNMSNRFKWTTNKVDKTVRKKYTKTIEFKFDDDRIARIVGLAKNNPTVIEAGTIDKEEQAIHPN